MKRILSLLLLLQASFSLLAQWTTNTDQNTLAAVSQTGDLQSVGASDGSTYIAYWHDVPAPKYYEMRLQRLDVNGVPMFGPEGMLVNDTVAMSSFTTTWSMAVDKENNAYIGFNGSDGGNPVYVHKITPAGVQAWGNAGVNLGFGFDVKVLPLSSGDVIATWLPGNKGAIQKISANGTVLWPAPTTIEPATSNHKSSAGELAELSDGGFIVIVHDRGGFSPSSLPYAQRYDGNGVAQWATPLALSNGYYTSFNRRYPLTQDGDNLYFGYTGAQGIQPFAFLQRINPDGTLPWGINGMRFSTQTAQFERDIKIAFSPGADVVWAICEYSNTSQGEVGEYVQKFDKVTGARLLTDMAKEVYPIAPAFISHRGSLQLINGKPLFIVSDGDSNGVFPKDLLAVYLDENGDFVWADKTRPVATNATGVKSRIQFNQPFGKQATCVWSEVRDNAVGRPYAQNISLECAKPNAGFSVSTEVLSATFQSQATGADSIFWDFGDGIGFWGNNPQHQYSFPGTYGVCQYAVNACGIDTVCQEIMIICSATPGFTYVINNLEVTFTTTDTLVTQTGWDFGDSALGSGNVVSHTYAQAGAYTVCQFVSGVCGTDAICLPVFIMSSGAHTPGEEYSIDISPNPNNGSFVIQVGAPAPLSIAFSIYATDGRLVQGPKEQWIQRQGKILVQGLDLAPGVYFVRLNMGGENVMRRVEVR